MTLFMVLMMVSFLAVLAMLWCFRGFTRELKQGRKPIGLLVRVDDGATAHKRIVSVKVVRPAPRSIKPAATPARARVSSAATVIGLAILLGSR
ncbi:MAG: hypothetical protein LAO20_10510 [Acidobacteriia bacterium]|nr:hypothetical protein [Terriglobia bacterium]